MFHRLSQPTHFGKLASDQNGSGKRTDFLLMIPNLSILLIFNSGFVEVNKPDFVEQF